MKKILAGALIGAFIFGVGVADINLASANSAQIEKNSTDKKNPPQIKNDNNKNNSDMKNPPEPPKDENGNPMPPPDKNSDNNKNHQQKK